ncbi:MAG: Fe-S cluster assembly protein SufD [Thermoflexales bacterium]|nr:Fe-S cluster assembly protein SufD [Thermoflexales bacterium]MDW8351168.1 Fe-S cluster assembly protein SufD [Anaerolineae bacterium]
MAVVHPVLKPAPVVKAGPLTRESVSAYSAALSDPTWMLERRMEALRVFRDTPAPNRHDELWRRVDLSTFKLDQILSGITPNNTVLDVHRSGLPDDMAQQGVIFASLETAIERYPRLLDEWMMTQCVKLTDAYYAALHAIFVRYGTVLYVPAGIRLDEPLRTTIRMAADQLAGFNHTLIVLEKGAKATLIEDFASPTGPHQAMYSGVVEIILGEGAELDYVSIQDWGRNVYNFTTERAKVGKEATLHWVIGGVGSKFTKSLIEADLVGPRGTALLSGVYFADAKQQLHYDTQQNHIAEACKSDLLYKAALRDEARTVWRGNIRVFPGAQKTDAYQANRNLQLSKRSRADSIPGLEIEADDVRCTHGSTVGTIEDEPMFYLRSRGIPTNEAYRLIVEGFFAPVIERIPLEETRNRLIEEIGKKIG